MKLMANFDWHVGHAKRTIRELFAQLVAVAHRVCPWGPGRDTHGQVGVAVPRVDEEQAGYIVVQSPAVTSRSDPPETVNRSVVPATESVTSESKDSSLP